MLCSKCNAEIVITNKQYKKDKTELEYYPECFDNFCDCPSKPKDINLIPTICKMCPYYTYSKFLNNRFENKEEKILKKELEEKFKSLTLEEQQELLIKIQNNNL